MKPANNDRRVFWGNTAWQYLLQIARYCFPFITLPYLTRVLGPETYAVRVYIVSVMAIVQTVLDYGFTTYGTKVIALHRDNKTQVGQFCYTIGALRIGLAFVSGCALCAVTFFIPILAENPKYVLLAFIGTCFKAMLPDFVFRGYEDMGVLTRRYLGSQLVSTVLILVFIKDPEGLLLVPLFEGVANLIAFIWSWWDVVCKRRIKLSRAEKGVYATAMKESSEFFISNTATQVISGVTTLAIGYFVTNKAEISYWSVSMTAIGAVQAMYSPISNSLYPHVVIRKDYALVRKALFIGIPAVLVGTVAFAILADPIMFVLGGEEYLEGSYLLRLLAPVLLLSYPVIILGTPVLGSAGKMRSMVATSIIAAAFHLAGLSIVAAFGFFQIRNIAILRCLTEAVLLAGRSRFSIPILMRGAQHEKANTR